MIDKTCPIKRATGDSDGGMPAISLATNDGESYIGPAIARCNGPACAWYDERREQCAVLTACLGVGK